MIGQADWPAMCLAQLPLRAREILRQVPEVALNDRGYLVLYQHQGADRSNIHAGAVPLAKTQWNIEKRQESDRLDPRFPWGIILHWYGDKEGFDKTLTGYLRGFDCLRQVENYITRTSAHFLIGDAEPAFGSQGADDPIGIIQTQAPDLDGTPFVSSHLRRLNYQSHKDKEQYFVRALYQLGYVNPKVHTLLQDLFDGPRIDPNLRTISIEVTGYDFENPEHYPSEQKIANVVGVVWAIMKRYGISAANILGHNEIQLGKPDPGKKFLALIRYLIGVKALCDNDEAMRRLVFGQYMGSDGDARQAVRAYFDFVRDYLVIISHPCHVYDWEVSSNYWLFYDHLADSTWDAGFAEQLASPITGKIVTRGDVFLHPENHEGMDIAVEITDPSRITPVNLVAGGECVFAGMSAGYHLGCTAIFRHRQPDGAQILTTFGNLNSLGNLKVGTRYPKGYRVGEIDEAGSHPYLHFAVGYGATWETDLRGNADIPTNAGTTWIKYRYMQPDDYLFRRLESQQNSTSYGNRL